MHSKFLAVALFAAPAFAALAINNPTLTQCQDAKITWQKGADGNAYNVIVVPAADVCATPYANLGDTPNTHATWKVNIPAGTTVRLSLIDSDGEEGLSDELTVQPSDDASCIPPELAAAAQSSETPGSTSETPGANSVPSPTSYPPAVDPALATPSSSSTSDPGAVAVGAANAGLFHDNGAVSVGFSGPIVALSAIAGAFALLL